MEQQVERDVVVPAPRAEVWEALTDAERLSEWFANRVELDPRPGGRGRFRWNDGDERYAIVEEVDAGMRFAFRWLTDRGEETTVVLTLADVPEGTRVTVVETSPGREWGGALALRALAFAHV